MGDKPNKRDRGDLRLRKVKSTSNVTLASDTLSSAGPLKETPEYRTESLASLRTQLESEDPPPPPSPLSQYCLRPAPGLYHISAMVCIQTGPLPARCGGEGEEKPNGKIPHFENGAKDLRLSTHMSIG